MTLLAQVLSRHVDSGLEMLDERQDFLVGEIVENGDLLENGFVNLEIGLIAEDLVEIAELRDLLVEDEVPLRLGNTSSSNTRNTRRLCHWFHRGCGYWWGRRRFGPVSPYIRGCVCWPIESKYWFTRIKSQVPPSPTSPPPERNSSAKFGRSAGLPPARSLWSCSTSIGICTRFANLSGRITLLVNSKFQIRRYRTSSSHLSASSFHCS